MEHDEFIGLVQDRARLDSRGAAESATRATLETLGDRLAGGLPQNIGDQLPAEIGRHLDRETTESFGIEEFWQKVADREGGAVDMPDAAFHARAVLSVVQDAITGDQLERAKDQLTPEYADLFDFSFA